MADRPSDKQQRVARANRIYHDAKRLPPDQRRAAVIEAAAGDDGIARAVLQKLRQEEPPQTAATSARPADAPADRERVAHLLDHALALPPEQRTEYLDSVAPVGGRLRSEVRMLLDAHERATGLLTDDRDPLIGAAIGPEDRYLVIRRLGEGGFARVYLASQRGPIERSVALKLLKPGLESESILARFDAERRALAMLEHPGIARVYDAGVGEDGRAYLAMEYIAGGPITRFADEERLSLDQRVELMIGVARAVHHAHSRGVLHRDLKPSNILARYQDGRPVSKVIDFGVAKALDPTASMMPAITREGQFIGTLEYMSPEQIRLASQLDERSDVYALGVVLYELLTGRLPFDVPSNGGVDTDELRRLITEVAPSAPSTRLRESLEAAEAERELSRRFRGRAEEIHQRLAGGLDAIVLRCLEKERDRRYPSASALADDLQAFLDGSLSPALRTPARAPRTRRLRTAITVALAVLAVVASGLFLLDRLTHGRLLARASVPSGAPNAREWAAELERPLRHAHPKRRRPAPAFVLDDAEWLMIEPFDRPEGDDQPFFTKPGTERRYESLDGVGVVRVTQEGDEGFGGIETHRLSPGDRWAVEARFRLGMRADDYAGSLFGIAVSPGDEGHRSIMVSLHRRNVDDPMTLSSSSFRGPVSEPISLERAFSTEEWLRLRVVREGPVLRAELLGPTRLVLVQKTLDVDATELGDRIAVMLGQSVLPVEWPGEWPPLPVFIDYLAAARDAESLDALDALGSDGTIDRAEADRLLGSQPEQAQPLLATTEADKAEQPPAPEPQRDPRVPPDAVASAPMLTMPKLPTPSTDQLPPAPTETLREFLTDLEQQEWIDQRLQTRIADARTALDERGDGSVLLLDHCAWIAWNLRNSFKELDWSDRVGLIGLDMWRRQGRRDLGVPWHTAVCMSHNAFDRGQHDRAVDLMRLAFDGRRLLLGPGDPAVWELAEYLGRNLQEAGRPDESIVMWRAAFGGTLDTLGEKNTLTWYRAWALGHAAWRAGQLPLATAAFRDGLIGRAHLLGLESPLTRDMARVLAGTLRDRGAPDGVTELLDFADQGGAAPPWLLAQLENSAEPQRADSPDRTIPLAAEIGEIPRVLADARADWRSHATRQQAPPQGHLDTDRSGRWFYGFEPRGASFKRFDTVTAGQDPFYRAANAWTEINRTFHHPAHATLVVRRWHTSLRGEVTIAFAARRTQTETTGDGVLVGIRADGVLVRQITIAGDETARRALEAVVPIPDDGVIDFLVDPTATADYDLVELSVRITLTAPPPDLPGGMRQIATPAQPDEKINQRIAQLSDDAFRLAAEIQEAWSLIAQEDPRNAQWRGDTSGRLTPDELREVRNRTSRIETELDALARALRSLERIDQQLAALGRAAPHGVSLVLETPRVGMWRGLIKRFRDSETVGGLRAIR